MRVFRTFDEAAGLINPVVTTGSFDGVHVGHKTILNRLKNLALKYNGESLLITFHPHPRKVLYPDTAGKDLKLINSQEEKLHLLEKTGLQNVLIVEFTREFSRITSEEFVRDLLKGKLDARVVVVGFNHHFGFNKEGDYRQLWSMRGKYNFEAEEIPEQEVQNESVSSTRIRKAISEGYIQRANAYLDHYYMVMGSALHAGTEEAGHILDFYRIALPETEKLLPSDGVYAVSIESGDLNSKAMAVICPGDGAEQKLFVHLPGYMRDINDSRVTLYFQKKITGRVDLENSSASESKLKRSLDEINDLVY